MIYKTDQLKILVTSMVNPKEDQESKNKQIKNNVKEEITTTTTTTKEFLDNQRQQLENTTSTISETTNRVNDNISQYQETNREILDKNIDTANRYQQETTNTIQSISNNYIELQKNIGNMFQSAFSTFLNYASHKSYWNNFLYPQRYIDEYNKKNQTITDNAINCTQRVNDIALASAETFNKSLEISQKYYNESVQNYYNFVYKISKSYIQ